MQHRMGKVMLLAVAVVGFSREVRAQAPASGTYSNRFSGAVSVWDVSGTYSQDAVLGGDCTISQDAQGKITGSGSASLEGLDMNYTVNGVIKGANGVTTVMWVQKFKGSGVGQDPRTGGSIPFTFSGAIKLDMTVVQASGSLSGKMTGNVCASAKGQHQCVSLEKLYGGPITFDSTIGGGMDGSWRLIMNVQGGGKTLVAAATVALSNGRTVQFAGKGKSQAGMTTLALKGNPISAKGANLKLIASGANMEITAVAGKLFGQTLKQ